MSEFQANLPLLLLIARANLEGKKMDVTASKRQPRKLGGGPAAAALTSLGLLAIAVALAWLALATTAGAQGPTYVASAAKHGAIAQDSSNAPWCGPNWITAT